MSLANLIVQPGRAILQADAAIFEPDGRVARFFPKLIAYDRFSSAVTMKGGFWDPEFYQRLRDLGAIPGATIGHLLADICEAFRIASTKAAERASGTAAALYFVGYDRAGAGPFGAIMTNDRAYFEGQLAPYEWLSVNNCVAALPPLDLVFGNAVDVSDPSQFNVDRDSVKLIEAQRRHAWGAWPVPDPRVAVAHKVGGWVDQAEATASGLEVTRICTWPDQVGELIQP